ncbi:expansin-B2-like [Phragmites australis]|uniref:expansin-B2-like n=1 Tax=Phragmites australis TaxID=29695 RepID=UPI002D767F5C|nr:expansin-B2-like [Phragmites australis]
MAAVIASRAAALVALFAVLATYGGRAEPVSNNATAARRLLASSSGWLPAKATWYGAPNGAGPNDNGGACGFKHTNQYPFMSMTSCGNEPLFQDGKGCGSCYQIRCVSENNPACSGEAKTVMITDMNYYPVAKYHFDLSGTAFGAMAKPGLNDKLRHAGIIDMQFRRVPCNHRGLTVNFHVEVGSNPVYLAVLVEYANKDGTVVQVDLMESNSRYWTPMRRSWGSIWRLDSNHPLKAPFSLRIRSESGKTLVANNVIPANWRPDADYRSAVQFT